MGRPAIEGLFHHRRSELPLAFRRKALEPVNTAAKLGQEPPLAGAYFQDESRRADQRFGALVEETAPGAHFERHRPALPEALPKKARAPWNHGVDFLFSRNGAIIMITIIMITVIIV